MCEPTTIALGAMAVAGAVQAYSQHEAGQAEKAADKYQSKVAQNNAILAQRSAQDAIDRGNVEASNQQLKNRQLMGNQKAQFAANGLLLSSGSVADVLGSQAATGQLDKLTILSNAQREAQGFKIEANNYTASSQLLKAQGAQAARAGDLAAIGTLASSAGSVAGKWSTMAGSGPSPKTTYGGAGTRYQRSNYSAFP